MVAFGYFPDGSRRCGAGARGVADLRLLAPGTAHPAVAQAQGRDGGERGLLHYSAVLNELRFSTDPVALDVLSLGELDRLRQPPRPGEREKMLELYRNAALLEIGVADEKKIKVVKVK